MYKLDMMYEIVIDLHNPVWKQMSSALHFTPNKLRVNLGYELEHLGLVWKQIVDYFSYS